MHDRTRTLSLISLLALGELLVLASKNPSGAHAATANSQYLAGQMPPGFDQDVARVVAEIEPAAILLSTSIYLYGRCLACFSGYVVRQ